MYRQSNFQSLTDYNFVTPFMTFYESRTRFRIMLRKYNPKNTVKMSIYVE